MIIVFEGHDGVGKATINNMLAGYLSQMEFTVYQIRNSLSNFGDICLQSTKLSVEEALKYQIRCSLMATLHASIILENEHKNYDYILMHRYYYSTYVYAHAMDILIPDISYLFPKPDFAFWVTCSEKQRKERILSRKTLSSFHDIRSLDKNLVKKANEAYEGFNLIQVNNFDLETCFKKVLEMIL